MTIYANSQYKVVIIGSGNVATHIAKRLDQSPNVRIAQIFSRKQENADRLCSILRHTTEEINDLGNMDIEADLYIISVKDDAIAEVASMMPRPNHGIIVHTSGSAPDNAAACTNAPYGVLYPLQTFSRDTDVDWTNITVFTYAENNNSHAVIDAVASCLSGNIRHIDGKKRATLHIAAIFACNFANYMWTESDRILRQCGCTLSDLSPLLYETLHKALSSSPAEAQTGPARRGDTGLINKHLDMISDCNSRNIYKMVSNAILCYYSENRTGNKPTDNE